MSSQAFTDIPYVENERDLHIITNVANRFFPAVMKWVKSGHKTSWNKNEFQSLSGSHSDKKRSKLISQRFPS